MGYRCPVCEEVTADGRHLAHHLAVLASLGRPDHASWLADVAPDWAERGPADLAGVLTPHAERVETDTGTDAAPVRSRPGPAPTDPEADPAVAAVLEEARRLTERMGSDSDE